VKIGIQSSERQRREIW